MKTPYMVKKGATIYTLPIMVSNSFDTCRRGYNFFDVGFRRNSSQTYAEKRKERNAGSRK